MVLRNVIFYLYLYFQYFFTKADISVIPVEIGNNKVRKDAKLPKIPLAVGMLHNKEPPNLSHQQRSMMNAEKSKEIIKIDLQSAKQNSATQQKKIVMRGNEQRDNISNRDGLTINVPLPKYQKETLEDFRNIIKKKLKINRFTTNQTSSRKEIFAGDYKPFLRRQKRNANWHTVAPYSQVLITPRRFKPVRNISNNVSNSSKEFSDSSQKNERTLPSNNSKGDDDGQKIHFRVYGEREQDRINMKEEQKKELRLQKWNRFEFYGKTYNRSRPYIYHWTAMSYIPTRDIFVPVHYSEIEGYFYYYDSEYVEYDLKFPMADYVPKMWKDRVPHPYGGRLVARQLFRNILKAMAQVGGSTFTRKPKKWFGRYDY